MYERNAIVLERYFYNLFDFKNSSNLRENYNNYRKLFECYELLCDAEEKEKKCQSEFDDVSNEVKNLQSTQEKLYNKGAKYEYGRYIIFNNISEAVEKIEKNLKKVSDDVEKNSIELKNLGEKFVFTINDYNLKKSNLIEAKDELEKAQKSFDNAYSEAKKCFNGIENEKVLNINNFINSDNKDNKKELQIIFEENGKNEKNQFDPDVILNTINKSFDIYKIEMEIYLAGYDRINKLFDEMEINSVKVDKHLKFYRDSKVKLDFLNAEKNYIVQFLDNERIGAIYDKKTHRKLMLEACKKFALDFDQINKLYEIILKEVAGRSTKKIYKENYNKEYIINLENASVEPSLDTGKMRQEAIAFVNLNYWRIEGMRSIYNVFEKSITDTYERDLTEFSPVEDEKVVQENSLVKEVNKNENIENVQEIKVEEAKDNSEQNKEIIKHHKVYFSSKNSLAKAIYKYLEESEKLEKNEELEEKNINNIKKTELKNVVEKQKNEEDSFDDDLKELEEMIKPENIETEEDETEDEESIFNDEDEKSILDLYFDENLNNEATNTVEKLKKKTGFFQKLVGFNSKEKKRA